MKILVAGAGIAGSVLTRMARERGHEVTLTDRQPHLAASRCAYAYLRAGWFRDGERVRARYALKYYADHGWVLADQATVRDVRRRRTFIQDDHYLIHPHAPLLKPDLAFGLTEYSDGPGGVLASLGPERVPADADHLVLAMGAGMNYRYHGTPTYGGVFESPDRSLVTPLNLLRISDRLTHVAADNGTSVRTAASKGRTPEEARRNAERILDRMLSEGLVGSPRGWTYRSGTRWTTLGGSPAADPISNHVWALTGFSRSGYATVPSYARDLLDRMERS